MNILVWPALDLRVAYPAEGLDLSRTGFPTQGVGVDPTLTGL